MKKIKVAIVDDEIEYVNDLAKGFEILGYEVVKAVSGAHAIEIINQYKPDIVLCDYKLDDMDGSQVIEKTKPKNPTMRYIVITAYYDESLKATFTRVGADEVIYKPIQILELDNVIKKTLDNPK